MEIVILLVPLAFLFLAAAIGTFVWAMRRGQFDDMDSPGWRIIFEDRESRDNEHAGDTDEQDHESR